MTNYEEDDLEEVEGNEPLDEAEAAPAANNRNFLLALGVLGGIFLLLIIGLVILFLNRRPGGTEAGMIQQTNQAIMTANAATAGAATQSAAILLTPSATLQPTNTSVPPTVTRTQVVALATATNTLAPGAAAIFTATSSPTSKVTGTAPAVLTQSAGQTRTQSVNLTATATRLPQSGFAEDVGLPGLFGMALGLVVLIVLVRRLRLSTNG